MRARRTPGRGERGFTLVEMLLVLAVVVLLVLGALDLFDHMNRVARVQVNLADLQQAQRTAQRELVRTLRMAGRGGLRELPVGVGSVASLALVAVRNNVGLSDEPQEVVAGEPALARAGSDVLVVRGVFTTPVYRVDYVDVESWDPANRRLVVRRVTPTGLPQDLGALVDAVEDAVPQALVLGDALGDAYGVAELVPEESIVTEDRITLAFRTAGSARADQYAALSSGGAFPAMDKVVTVGLLEELRFYVTEGGDGPGLARARVFPGTEEVVGGELAVELAPGIEDLQVALGFDAPLGGFFACDDDAAGDDDRLLESADGAGDDWLFNRPGAAGGEDAAAVPWSPPGGGWDDDTAGCAATPRPRLYFARVSTLARTENADPYHRSETVDGLEDRRYGLAADDPINGDTARRFRRRVLTTTIDLRNS